MRLATFLILILLLTACPGPYNFDYDIIVTDFPTNLEALNTKLDDYNSDLPYPYDGMEINFSTNIKSNGNNFNIVARRMSFSYHEEDDILDVTIPYTDPLKQEELLFPLINTEKDELGPFSFFSDRDLCFMFASGLNDSFAIFLLEYTNWDYPGLEHEISGPAKLPGINDHGSNLYPSVSRDRMSLFFCSNRSDTAYSIYEAAYESVITWEQLMDEVPPQVVKNETLSSPYDDKCPFVNENLMVFTSNRSGGSGGYDLWYSRFENESWSAPVNFGEKINSEYDEYRPVVFEMLGFDLMIFSSNRPEGMGGFDLYIVKTEI
jgi:hypothetical protein